MRDCATVSPGRPGRVEIGSGPNRRHLVQIAGFTSSRGRFTIDVLTNDTIGSPDNDQIENAIEIERLPFVDTRDVRTAGVRAGEQHPHNGCYGSGDFNFTVWYRFRPVSDVRLAFSTLGSDYETILGIYDDFGLHNHDEAEACVVAPDGRSLPLVFDAAGGETYWIQVASGWEERAGRLVLSVLPLSGGGP